jgi:hypothetical protein
MGDMADYTLDIMFSDGRWENNGWCEGPPIRYVTCRCCGKEGLHWSQHMNGKWRLFDECGIHKCSVNPLKE